MRIHPIQYNVLILRYYANMLPCFAYRSQIHLNHLTGVLT